MRGERLAIVGSRSFGDYELMARYLDAYDHERYESRVGEIVSGGAKGADSLAARWARERGVALKEFLPDWDKYGKSAGMRRNAEIVDYADSVIAFWDGESKGTANTILRAQKAGKLFWVVYFKPHATKAGDELAQAPAQEKDV